MQLGLIQGWPQVLLPYVDLSSAQGIYYGAVAIFGWLARTIALPQSVHVCTAPPEVSSWCTVVPTELVKPPVSEGGLDITSNSNVGGNRVTGRCGTAGLGGRCPRGFWLRVQRVSCDNG